MMSCLGHSYFLTRFGDNLMYGVFKVKNCIFFGSLYVIKEPPAHGPNDQNPQIEVFVCFWVQIDMDDLVILMW